ncbi:MAG: hypothetical protein FJZ95_08355 [Chloroflexi bacterium]|nr:hypothetical protein [Chloroflexota bacterium]
MDEDEIRCLHDESIRQQQNLNLTPSVRIKLRMMAIMLEIPMNQLVEDLVTAMWGVMEDMPIEKRLNVKAEARLAHIIERAAEGVVVRHRREGT